MADLFDKVITGVRDADRFRFVGLFVGPSVCSGSDRQSRVVLRQIHSIRRSLLLNLSADAGRRAACVKSTYKLWHRITGRHTGILDAAVRPVAVSRTRRTSACRSLVCIGFRRPSVSC